MRCRTESKPRVRSAAAVTAAGEKRRAAGRAWTVLGESSSAGDLVRRWMLLWEMGWPAAVASSATRRSLSFWVSMASRIRSPRGLMDMALAPLSVVIGHAQVVGAFM
ncbi:hypothetical protein DWQ67_00805 [Galactobacter caseinivorans]|uniref:Uncharacterized protein n=1 Tax=Galactobacter caseinivorans TaxID=2676123 RepID=A0A496PLM0_9MICC|nr:hypothetical protein DWQ67_00805 [Galactobacter caseinivorans]